MESGIDLSHPVVQEMLRTSKAQEFRESEMRNLGYPTDATGELNLLETQLRTRAAQIAIEKDEEASDIRVMESLGMSPRAAAFAAKGRGGRF